MAEPIEDPLSETGQAIGSALRTGAVAAGELVRMRLLRQAQRDHEATQAAQLEARALAERLKAERPLAAVLYRPTRDPAWWDQATTDDVARAFDAASAFADVDPDARAALEDLDRGLEERPQLRERLLRDHPESLAAQSLAPLASGAGQAGVVLAIAADLDLDATADMGLSEEEQEQAWRAIPPEPEPAAEEQDPSRTPPDPGLSEEELWSGTPSQPEPIGQDEAWYPDTEAQLTPEREPDRSPAGGQAPSEADAWPPTQGDRVVARASPEYQEGAGVAALVGADFPDGVGAPGASAFAAQAALDTGGIGPIAAEAGDRAGYEEAAGVIALVRADFPAGDSTAAVAAAPGPLPAALWGVRLVIAGNLTPADPDLTRADGDLTHGLAHARLLLARPDLDLAQHRLAAPAAER